MTHSQFDWPGPGLPLQAYLALLATGHETGWWDEHGNPAPWPEDFLDPDSGWQPAGGDHPTHPDHTTF